METLTGNRYILFFFIYHYLDNLVRDPQSNVGSKINCTDPYGLLRTSNHRWTYSVNRSVKTKAYTFIINLVKEN